MLYEKSPHNDKNLKASFGFIRAAVAGVLFFVAVTLVLFFMKERDAVEGQYTQIEQYDREQKITNELLKQQQQAARQRAIERFEKEEAVEEQLMKHNHPYDFKEDGGDESPPVYLNLQQDRR